MPKKIVIVHRSEQNLAAIGVALSGKIPGYEVEVFSSPSEAMEAVYQPDFILYGLLFLGKKFAKCSITAEALLEGLQEMDPRRIIRMSVFEPEEQEKGRCIMPSADAILAVLREFKLI